MPLLSMVVESTGVAISAPNTPTPMSSRVGFGLSDAQWIPTAAEMPFA
jgi:hypothetical protein